ncbi:MAG: GNAT family N-acetyltransferase [Trebonia sp.]
MGWSTTSDLEQFAAAAGGYLTSRAAENTLLLSAAQAARQAGAGQPGRAGHQGAGLLYGWWTPPDGGDPRSAFVDDPAAPLLISGGTPEMAAALAVTLSRLGRQVCGVDAPTEAADAFGAAWRQRAGTTVRAHRNCRVYRLTAAPPGAQSVPGTSPRATPPHGMPASWTPPATPGPAGRARVATAADRELLAGWLQAAAIEEAQRLDSPSGLAAGLIGYHGAVFWEIPCKPGLLRDAAHNLAVGHRRDAEVDYQPVAFAALTRPVARTIRISMVYTVPHRRRSGYAGAVTQAVSRALLWGGDQNLVPGLLAAPSAPGCVREVVMITDKSRPDRWGVRLGFQLAGERAVLRFGPPTGALPRLPRLRR